MFKRLQENANALITNDYILPDLNEVVFVTINQDMSAIITGKSNDRILLVQSFAPELYDKHNFIKINSCNYINPVHITTINTKKKHIQLLSNVILSYDAENETKILSYLNKISI